MKAYFDSIEKEVPEALREVFLDRHDTAVITIDMHDGHLSTDPDCPCPSPRGREIIEPLNHFMDEARALGLPVIHVRSTLRKDGADEKLFPSACASIRFRRLRRWFSRRSAPENATCRPWSSRSKSWKNDKSRALPVGSALSLSKKSFSRQLIYEKHIPSGTFAATCRPPWKTAR